MRKARLGFLAFSVLAVVACTASKAYQKDLDDANATGKYKVRLTTDPEVVGTCKFLKAIDPRQDPVGGILQSQYPDYFRVHAVLIGADTVLVREGKIGECYQCGPTLLNPDGSPKAVFDTPPQHP